MVVSRICAVHLGPVRVLVFLARARGTPDFRKRHVGILGRLGTDYSSSCASAADTDFL